jgi:hypothetical protein
MTAVKMTITAMEEIKHVFIDLVLSNPKIDSAVGALQANLGTLRVATENLSATTNMNTFPTALSSSSVVGPRQEMHVEVMRSPLGD